MRYLPFLLSIKCLDLPTFFDILQPCLFDASRCLLLTLCSFPRSGDQLVGITVIASGWRDPYAIEFVAFEMIALEQVKMPAHRHWPPCYELRCAHWLHDDLLRATMRDPLRISSILFPWSGVQFLSIAAVASEPPQKIPRGRVVYIG